MKFSTPFLLMATLATGFAASPTPPLASHVFNWADLSVKLTAVGQRRDVADQATATFDRFESHISTLNSGCVSHLPHHHPQEELILLKDGHLAVHINGQEHVVGPGSLFFFASHDLHAVRNIGAGPATYYVFNVETAATRSVPTTPAAESAAPNRLRSQVFDWEKLVAKPTPKGARRDVFDSPTVTCANFESHITTINPGEVPHAPHHHPDEEIIVLKEGRLEVTINGVAHSAAPGAVIFYAANVEHGMRNIGDVPATYYVIRIVAAATPQLAAK